MAQLAPDYPDGFLFVYLEDNKLKIGTSGHQLFDYDFLIMEEVEKILKKYKVVLTKKKISNSSTITRIYNDKNQNKIIYPKKGFLQVVGSDLKKHNAENCMLRLDCNLDFKNKSRFIEDLKDVTNEERVDVFFIMTKILMIKQT